MSGTAFGFSGHDHLGVGTLDVGREFLGVQRGSGMSDDLIDHRLVTWGQLDASGGQRDHDVAKCCTVTDDRESSCEALGGDSMLGDGL